MYRHKTYVCSLNQQALSACCGAQVHWFQVQFVHPVIAWWIDTVLGTWEETLKALVREVNTLSCHNITVPVVTV